MTPAGSGLPDAERLRIQRRNAVRTGLTLAVVALLVFLGYIVQVARVAG